MLLSKQNCVSWAFGFTPRYARALELSLFFMGELGCREKTARGVDGEGNDELCVAPMSARPRNKTVERKRAFSVFFCGIMPIWRSIFGENAFRGVLRPLDSGFFCKITDFAGCSL